MTLVLFITLITFASFLCSFALHMVVFIRLWTPLLCVYKPQLTRTTFLNGLYGNLCISFSFFRLGIYSDI